jgi:hypothetical protein
MTEEPREPTPEELAAKRAAFDRVFAAAKAERTDMISLYDITMWLLYCCYRSDAINTVKEFEQDDDDGSEFTVRDEIDESMDAAMDDSDGQIQHERDAKALGEQLDPDFDRPARLLTDWLD